MKGFGDLEIQGFGDLGIWGFSELSLARARLWQKVGIPGAVSSRLFAPHPLQFPPAIAGLPALAGASGLVSRATHQSCILHFLICSLQLLFAPTCRRRLNVLYAAHHEGIWGWGFRD